MVGENWSQKLGGHQPRTGGSCVRFRFQVWASCLHLQVCLCRCKWSGG